MIFKYWLFMVFIGVAAYGSTRVLNGAHMLYSGEHWQYYAYLCAPYVLLWLSAKGWRTSRMWRRMMAQRQERPTLSRGEQEIRATKERASVLERICAALFVLACAAILKLLSVQHIEWWVGSFVCAALFVRMLLMAVRRP